MNQPAEPHPLAQDPRFQQIVRRRSAFSWQLSAAAIALYFGFIGLIAFRREVLAIPLGSGVTSLGIPVGIGLIVISIAMTGVYVWRANREFDPAMRALLKEYGE